MSIFNYEESMQLLADMQPRPIPGEPERYRVTEKAIGKPWDVCPLRPLNFWFRTRRVFAFGHPISPRTPNVYALHLQPPSAFVRFLLHLLQSFPSFIRSWFHLHLPEWFLPNRIVLKCQKRGTDVEYADDERLERLFEAEHYAYNRLKPIQGLTIPRCYGSTHFSGRKALILQHCPGETLEQPEAATLSYSESKKLLGDSFNEMADQGAVQQDASLSNFILAPDKRRITAVGLERVTFPNTSEDIECHSLLSMQTTLENYLGRQRFLRSDGYLEAA
ncbi:unnamed protein product [Clonostachys byssicola]|uniref:Uncharacterized protein n=1 Tax=Clonostachys byssicola TaxID=160290 RepID=A0A9N9UAF8_9HYPO|nr:unnamed protein product [Clonostachys byssicola]